MTFDAKAFIAEQVEAIRTAVPGKAIIACSGGVDRSEERRVGKECRL